MNRSEQEQTLLDVFDRQATCDSLNALASALRSDAHAVGLMETAIGLDANVFLRLTSHKKAEDIIDYLVSTHSAPLIIPGQAIQEFWNNHLYAVDTIAATLRKKFESFKIELERLDPHYDSYVNPIEETLDRFRDDHGHLFDESVTRKTLAFLEALQERALVPYASRSRFQQAAVQRKRTRTPPGFKDDGDGDFFVWVDFLSGLQVARAGAQNFSRVVFVSIDKKPDWSRAGVAHPILAAEVRTLLNVPFEIWTTDKLAEEISRAT